MKIAFYNCGKGGVAQYRCLQPMKALLDRGHEVYQMPVMDTPEKQAIGGQILDISDICFIMSPMSENWVEFFRDWKVVKQMEALENIEAKRCKFVVDYDDNPFNIPPTNEVYVNMGRYEVKYGDEWLWRDGDTHMENGRVVEFNVNRNNKRVLYNIPQILKNADLVTTTTNTLKTQLLKSMGSKDFAGDKVSVLPNGVNLDVFNADKKVVKNDGVIRIAWTVSSSHFLDWAYHRKAIGNVLKRNLNVRLVIFGEKFGAGRDVPLSQIEQVPWVDGLNGYAKTLAEYGIDIGIAPLIADEFNACKSSLKWEEYSSLKIPALVSSIVYDSYVQDGKTGLIYNTLEEFEDKLQRLIDSVELRKDIADAAYSEIKEKYDIKIVAEKYEREFKNLLFKDKILNGGSK